MLTFSGEDHPDLDLVARWLPEIPIFNKHSIRGSCQSPMALVWRKGPSSLPGLLAMAGSFLPLTDSMLSVE